MPHLTAIYGDKFGLGEGHEGGDPDAPAVTYEKDGITYNPDGSVAETAPSPGILETMPAEGPFPDIDSEDAKNVWRKYYSDPKSSNYVPYSEAKRLWWLSQHEEGPTFAERLMQRAGEVAGTQQAESNLPPVVQAVRQATADPRVQRAMLLGARLEGGSFGRDYGAIGGPRTGDGGVSVGPWQINFSPSLTVNGARVDGPFPITPEQAADPEIAARWIVGRYEAAAAAQPAELWDANPFQWALNVVFEAEKPADLGGPNATYGEARAWQAWLDIEQARYATGTAPGAGRGVAPRLTPEQEAEAHAWGLSDQQAQDAVIFGLGFEDYAKVLDLAKRYGIEPAHILIGDWQAAGLRATAAAMEELGITDPSEFLAAVDVGLSPGEIKAIKTVGGNVVQWVQAMKSGLSYDALMAGNTMGYDPGTMLLAAHEGATLQDLREWRQRGRPVTEGIAELRRQAEATDKLAQIQADLNRQFSWLPEDMRSDLRARARELAAGYVAGTEPKLDTGAVVDAYLKSAGTEEVKGRSSAERLQRLYKSVGRHPIINPYLYSMVVSLPGSLTPLESLSLQRGLERAGITQPALQAFLETLPPEVQGLARQRAIDEWIQGQLRGPQQTAEQEALARDLSQAQPPAFTALFTPPRTAAPSQTLSPPPTEQQKQEEQQKEEERKEEERSQEQSQQGGAGSSTTSNVYAPPGGLAGGSR